MLETVPARNLAYVAKWLVNRYAIAFDMNGGQTNGETTMELEYGSPIQAPIPTRTGHTFNGWSPSVPSEVPVGGGTYVAQWTPNQYVVTFDANGGEGGTQETMEYGAEITPPTVTKEGYVFNGWMPEVDSVVPANDVTYVAQWEEEYEPPFDDPVGLPEVDLESPPDSDF